MIVSAAGRCEPSTPADQPEDGRDLGRVLIVAREMTPGGAAYLALRHVRELAPTTAIDLLVTGVVDDDFVREFPPSVTVFRLNQPKIWLEGDPFAILRRFSYEQGGAEPFRRRYHTVLATSIFPDPVACAAVLTVRALRRLVFLVDESVAICAHYAPHERALIEECVRAADLVLPVSGRLWDRMADRFPVLHERPRVVLHPPVDTAKIRQLAAEPQATIVPGSIPNLLTIARFSPDKRIVASVHLHHMLKEAGLAFRWFVIGVGEEEAQVREAIESLGMTDDFLLLGRRDDLYALVQAADAFVLLSEAEGCPTVVIEALALGCPVLMTEVSGADELLEGGDLGVIVGHDIPSILEGLTRLVTDAALRDEFRARILARNARQHDSEAEPSLASLLADPQFVPTPRRATIQLATPDQAESLDPDRLAG